MASSNGESVVSNVSISQRAEALEQAESASKQPEQKIEEKAPELKTPELKTPEQKAPEQKVEDKKEVKAEKKAPNDPDELRKWNTRVSQENKKLRDEMAAVREAQEKTYKLLASMSKKPVDFKELAKNPEAVQKFVEEERQNATAEMKQELDRLSAEAKSKDTAYERMRREHDTENYPEWKRLYPSIVKIAMGPTGQGDPRVDFTKPASEVLDRLYEIALEESPKAAEVAKDPEEKVYKESEMKQMLADMLTKEREAISKSAKEEAAKEAQKQLSEEAKGGTVASGGKGAGRVPSDQLAAFKKMSLAQQREWLQAQNS